MLAVLSAAICSVVLWNSSVQRRVWPDIEQTTRLFDADVDGQLITEVPGHRSLAVQGYKRTGETKRKKISDIVQGSIKRSEDTAQATAPASVTININLN